MRGCQDHHDMADQTCHECARYEPPLTVAALRSRIVALERERDEADRAAGEARRKLDALEDAERRRRNWIYKATLDAGFPCNASFDEVWAAALKALRQVRDEKTVR